MSSYQQLKKQNPTLPILVREAEGVKARLIARFGGLHLLCTVRDIADRMPPGAVLTRAVPVACRLWRGEERHSRGLECKGRGGRAPEASRKLGPLRQHGIRQCMALRSMWHA